MEKIEAVDRNGLLRPLPLTPAETKEVAGGGHEPGAGPAPYTPYTAGAGLGSIPSKGDDLC